MIEIIHSIAYIWYDCSEIIKDISWVMLTSNLFLAERYHRENMCTHCIIFGALGIITCELSIAQLTIRYQPAGWQNISWDGRAKYPIYSILPPGVHLTSQLVSSQRACLASLKITLMRWSRWTEMQEPSGAWNVVAVFRSSWEYLYRATPVKT